MLKPRTHFTYNLNKLPEDIFLKIATFLPEEDVKRAEREFQVIATERKLTRYFFQPIIDKAETAYPLLKAVVTGNIDQLIDEVRKKPYALFMQGDVKDASGQVFYKVSSYQMIKFLCDEDMLIKIMRLIFPLSERLAKLKKTQDAKLTRGGADFIKVDRDPATLMFEDILEYQVMYALFDGQSRNITFSLLKNPDGIIYYKDEGNQIHWYYVNQIKRTIEPIKLIISNLSSKQQCDFNELMNVFDAMIPFSARRSNNNERQLIEDIFGRRLYRNGIQYDRDGVRYCDTHYDFNRYDNAYRKYIILHKNDDLFYGNLWESNLKPLQYIQREVMWILQRYCERNRRFYPLPNFKDSEFNRGFTLFSWLGRETEVYNDETGFINVSRAICKGNNILAVECKSTRASLGHIFDFYYRWIVTDFIAINQLIKDARENIVECNPDERFVMNGLR